ncbi:HAMP domain-containing protein [Rhodopseudomonas sp. WA056]|uniref:ATP-binding protein n=1 Tax=Rhodopseudomonas sp. WA056 TaxID=2269367 RepID=UPI0013DE9846|nr:ATP-binding protein [Rhodopseudomonas sp. WA056]NEW89328.1 HAMP domain-containing protein [Rhodopseudomonas sp. WA056]
MSAPRRLAALKFGLGLEGVRGQIAILVLASIIASHLIIAVVFFVNRPDRPMPSPAEPQQLHALAQLIGRSAAADRPQLIATIAAAFPRLELTAAASPPADADERQWPPHDIAELGWRLGPNYRVASLGDGKVVITLPDGAAIGARMPPERRRPPWGNPWMASLLIGVVSLALLGLWAARTLAAPLSSFAAAAENFSLDSSDAPLPERGPAEIRSLARALNRMRGRITTLIEDRTRMLAAISHDLRTPITRMRLRAEFIEDEHQRTQTLHDLDQMGTMLTAVLTFLRDGATRDAPTLIDLASAMQLIADQFTDIGAKVAYQGPEHAMAMARPGDLHRAVTNLVENAVRFGTEVTIRLALTQDTITIEVEDDGPGIADADKDSALQPFVRGDDARNMDDNSSFGLGLSIARAIARGHRGELSLHNRTPNGLTARITLPRQKPDRSAA